MKQIALVTGGTRGIGRAVALRFAEKGYTVIICGRSLSDEAKETLCRLRAFGDADFFACDVADPAQVKAMAQEVENKWGTPDVLVNNAGIARQELFSQITDEAWDTMMGVHLNGTFYVTRAFLPGMLRRHNGSVINLSSMWGQVGGSCEVAYSAAKAGVIGLTKALAKEAGPSGVRVNCVAPGVIDTAMMADFDEQIKKDLADETPLGRLGTPEDVANAVVFLAGEEASFITGQILAPNGGLII